MADFCTLAEAKAWAGISVDTEDTLIGSILTAVTQGFQVYLGRDVLTGSFAEKYNGNDQATLRLNQYPITAVSSLSIDGTAIPLAANSQGSGYLFSDQWIYLYGYRFARGHQNVLITYTAGYADPPPRLNIAAREQVAYEYRRRSRIGEKSRSLGGQVVAFQIMEFTDAVKAILDAWRRKL